MFKSFFKSEDDGVERGRFEEDENSTRTILRKARMRIVKTQIVYDGEEGVFVTVAACINEDNQLETISIEGFNIDSSVTNLVGAYIDYEEFEEYDEEGVDGKIVV